MATAPQIVILDGYTVEPGDNPWQPVADQGRCTVYERTPPESVLERAAAAEIILTSKVRLTADMLQQLPQLRFISLLATGYNNVDVVWAGQHGIPVANVPAYSTASVAQATFALLLELTNQAGLHDRAVKEGEWLRCPDYSFRKTPLVELDGRTLGIVGFGAIGRAVARIGTAFGMAIIAYTPHPPAADAFPGVRFVPVEELFSQADVVSLNCPQTADNAGFVNAALLARMKRSAFLLNVARGGLVNETDLAAALKDGVIAGAGLDVVAVEPMQADNPLRLAPRCIITPHIAWASLAARQRLTSIVAANVAGYLAGQPINLVNSSWLPPADIGAR